MGKIVVNTTLELSITIVKCFIRLTTGVSSVMSSVTILGNLLHFGQVFKVCDNNYLAHWEVVVAQLVEQSLSIPEVRGLTPVNSKILLSICLLSTVLIRQK